MFRDALMFDDLIDDIMMIISNSNIFWIGICWIMDERLHIFRMMPREFASGWIEEIIF
jgi:hypothetical protein